MRPCIERKLGPTAKRPCLRAEDGDNKSGRRVTSDDGVSPPGIGFPLGRVYAQLSFLVRVADVWGS